MLLWGLMFQGGERSSQDSCGGFDSRSLHSATTQKKEDITLIEVKVYGCSDDLVEIEGDVEGADEYSSDGSSSFILMAPDGGTAIIYVDYRLNGIWSVAFSRYEEDYQLPEWDAKVVTDDSLCRYSDVLVLSVPDGTTISELDKDS